MIRATICTRRVVHDLPEHAARLPRGSAPTHSTRRLDRNEAGTPAAADPSCDGVDDDCDGVTDEDFLASCAGTSAQRCGSGQLVSVECSDGDACNGSEACVGAGQCEAGTPPVVDDGDPCTADGCSPSSGVAHAPLPEGTSCGQNLVCDASGACVTEYEPPVIVEHPSGLTVSVGQSFELYCAATGTQLSYRWQRFGADIPGASAATYASQGRFELDGSLYSCVVSNPVGTVTSEPALLTVIDDVSPELSVEGPVVRGSQIDVARLSGTATDSGSGVESVYLTSSRYGAQTFGTIAGEAGAFSAEAPLFAGENVITVFARDRAGNMAQQAITVHFELPSVPIVRITAPADGSIVTTTSTTVAGTVRSTLPAEEIRLTLGSQVAFPTGSDGEYAFEFEEVPLSLGLNSLVVRAETTHGVVAAEARVTLQEQPDEPAELPPQIRVDNVDLEITGDTVPVSGTASAEPCVDSVLVNGLSADVTGSGASVSFDALVEFIPGDDAVDILVEAIGCNGLVADLTYTVQRDTTAPEIAVSGLELAPSVNAVAETPYTVRGTVTETRLAGFTTNDQSVGVLAGATANEWDFSFDVALARGQGFPLVLEAWDFAGNRSNLEITLQLDSSVGIEIVAPRPNAEFVASGGVTSVTVTAQASGLAADDILAASVDGALPLVLTRSGSSASGTLEVTGPGSKRKLTVEAQSSTGTLLARASTSFSVVSSDDVLLELVRQDPANGAVNVEPNAPITFYFNKPIDPAYLSLDVTETVHGKIYAEAEPGADFRQLTQVRMMEIHRDNEPVAGSAALLPGDSMVAFYPGRDYGYGGQVLVTVAHDGVEISRAAFGIRPTPTLIEGFVTDSELVPLPGIQVSLPALGRTTVTDSNGQYSFGFGDFEDAIVGGRYRTVINPGQKHARFGTVERWIAAADQRLTNAGATRLLTIGASEPYEDIGSGLPQGVLADGLLRLDLSEAELTFPNGAPYGPVHARFAYFNEVPYPLFVGIGAA